MKTRPYTLSEQLKGDVPAGLVVFLVALPLCLGIALASGAPPLSGILSGIIGGLVVGGLSLSQTSVSGPAAGLTTIVAAAIVQLGSFDAFLVAVLLAGFLQLLMGLFRLGFISNYVPSNVVKGLLAAIGLLLILKQIPHAFGFDRKTADGSTFFELDGGNTFTELLEMLEYIEWSSVIVTGISLFILLLWDKTPAGRQRFLPASLVVVFMGIGLNALFCWLGDDWCIAQSHLVSIPPIDAESLSKHFHLPTLSQLSDRHIYFVALEIAFVASLETILNIEAVDKIDPLRRRSPINRELVAQGLGNMTAGLVGALPITSVIVRSSVNIHSGNRSKWSAIFHGLFMLVSVLLLQPYLNLIPLASLAAILLITGYKLAKISLFQEMYRRGNRQFIPFLVTVFAIVFTDLLVGILIGLAFSILYLLQENYRNPFTLKKEILAAGEVLQLELSEEVSFLNLASIRETLDQVPPHSKLVIDAVSTTYVDDDVLELLEEFSKNTAPERHIQLNIIGLRSGGYVRNTTENGHFVEVLDKETQQHLSPEAVLNILRIGNHRFLSGKSFKKHYQQQLDETARSQNPVAAIVCCSDMHVSPDIIFDANIGDLLVIRLAGNVVNDCVIGTAELAVRQMGVRLLVVMGHSGCASVRLALQGERQDGLSCITSRLALPPNAADMPLEQVVRFNTQHSFRQILQLSPFLRRQIQSGKLGMMQAHYDAATGKVEFEYVPVEEE